MSGYTWDSQENCSKLNQVSHHLTVAITYAQVILYEQSLRVVSTSMGAPGNYESRNGMERGTEVRCGPRARLDWTHPKICKMPFSV